MAHSRHFNARPDIYSPFIIIAVRHSKGARKYVDASLDLNLCKKSVNSTILIIVTPPFNVAHAVITPIFLGGL